MRSGSTLLKALLSEAPEIDHLNEVNFILGMNKYAEYFFFYRLSPKKIILIKRPSAYEDFEQYPILPKIETKNIILFRNPTDTFLSIKSMNEQLNIQKDDSFLFHYLNITYQKLLCISNKENIKKVVYSDLIEHPFEVTQELFEFIGSSRTEGTNTYSLPISSEWQWGKDDGSETIKTLMVKKIVKESKERDEWSAMIKEDTDLLELWLKIKNSISS